MQCPRCGAQIRSGRFRGVDVSRCPDCRGVLVELRNNVPFLDRLVDELAADVDLETPIDPVAGPFGVATCPRCAAAMERFGYLGTKTVILDRCSPCLLIWHDGDELGTTAALHARTTRRKDARERQLHADISAQNRRVDLLLRARGEMDRLFVEGRLLR